MKKTHEEAMTLWLNLCKQAVPLNAWDLAAAQELLLEDTGWTYDEIWEEWHLQQDYSRS